MTSQALEFHDSRIVELTLRGDGIGELLLHGSVYRSDGQVFVDAQESGWQNVRLRFRDMSIEGKLLSGDAYLADGDFYRDGKVIEPTGTLSLPLIESGALEIRMVPSPLFEPFVIRASQIQGSVEGDFEIEAVWDSKGGRTRINR